MKRHKKLLQRKYKDGVKVHQSLSPRISLPSHLMVVETTLVEDGAIDSDSGPLDYIVVKFVIGKVID